MDFRCPDCDVLLDAETNKCGVCKVTYDTSRAMVYPVKPLAQPANGTTHSPFMTWPSAQPPAPPLITAVLIPQEERRGESDVDGG